MRGLRMRKLSYIDSSLSAAFTPEATVDAPTRSDVPYDFIGAMRSRCRQKLSNKDQFF